MKFTNIRTIFRKQCKETIANKEILIQFILCPLFAVILTYSVSLDDMPADFFVKMFGAMYLGMAPLVTTCSIIAEEKEKNTLRMLLFSNVKASEYLIGISAYVFLFCSLGSIVMACVGGYTASQALVFVVLSQIGILISILVGACLGLNSKNQMGAVATSLPMMMLFSFIPMLSMFNEGIKAFGYFVFTQQINLMFDALSFSSFTGDFFLVMVCSMLAATLIFLYTYRKRSSIL